jgi:Snf7
MLMEQNKVMGQQLKHINPDAIADAQEDMRDIIADTQEMTEILGQDFGVDGIDDAELEAELEGLGEEMGFGEAVGAHSTPSYLPVAQPESLSARPSYLEPNAGSAAPQYGR